jgi:hypothetical protein
VMSDDDDDDVSNISWMDVAPTRPQQDWWCRGNAVEIDKSTLNTGSVNAQGMPWNGDGWDGWAGYKGCLVFTQVENTSNKQT